MEWFKLLKQPKLRAGSKVTTNLGIDSEKDENTPCKRKIQEYMDKANRMGQDGYHRVGNQLQSSTIAPDWPEEIYCSALKKLNEFSFEKLNKEEIRDAPGGYEWWQDVHADLGDYVINGYYGGRYELHGDIYTYMTLKISKMIPDELIFIRHYGGEGIGYKGRISDFHESIKEVDWR